MVASYDMNVTTLETVMLKPGWSKEKDSAPKLRPTLQRHRNVNFSYG